MTMTMTNKDILKNYNEAKTPSKQIGILADMNCCTRKEIVDILRAEGADLPAYYDKPKMKHAAATKTIKVVTGGSGVTLDEWTDAMRCLGWISGYIGWSDEPAQNRLDCRLRDIVDKLNEVMVKVKPLIIQAGGITE